MRCLLALALVLMSAAAAAQSPRSLPADTDSAARVHHIEYRDNLVVKIAGFPNTPFVVEMPADEPIGDVAAPMPLTFEIIKKASRLFVRPLAGIQPATVLVTTKTRSIVIDLFAGTPQAYKERLSKLVVSLPRPAAPAVEKMAPAPAVDPKVSAASTAPPSGEPKASYRNESYTMQVVSEVTDVRPREAFDNGRFTYFKFPNNIEVPAIYRSVPGSQEEWLVNSHREGDYVVMHAVAPLWTFRLGGTVLGIFNDSYEADGVPPANGSTVPGVERVQK